MGILLSLGAAACAPADESSAGVTTTAPPASGAEVGSVSFELSLGGTYKLDSVSYQIDGNGFHRGATVNVAQSSTFSTLVSDIPVGMGYVASLTAQDTAQKLTPCVGSATFNVASGSTANVPVHLTCHVVPQVTTPPPPSIPVPRAAGYALAALLAAAGLTRLRRSVV
jgi:hypothetical protein